MTEPIHENYVKSSNLIFAVVGVILINLILLPRGFINSYSISLAVIGAIVFASLGLLIRKGLNWTKYVLLTLILLGAVTVPMIVVTFYPASIGGFMNIVQQVLLVWALVLLFRIPKKGMTEV
ncbi:MAG TPA: hypothetical protein VF676_03480 [Flavobacterium sp.]|jgi:hypothetical protein